MARRKTGILASLRARGFDTSRVVPFERGAKVGCSQCEAVCVNGVPCHESGCPNQTFECKGCDAIVSWRGSYCDDCVAGFVEGERLAKEMERNGFAL